MRFRAALYDGALVGGMTVVLCLGLVIVAATAGGGSGDLGVAAGVVAVALFPITYAGYTAWRPVRRGGQTAGKRAKGIAVRDAKTLEPVGSLRLVFRSLLTMILCLSWVLASAVSWGGFVVILFFLDILWPLWDRRRRSLRDLVVRTVVISTGPTATTA